MSAHPSIQDLSSEAELVSHDISPLPSVGYRQHACISDSWRPQAGLGSRHDGIRSSPRCIDVKIQWKNLVEIVVARLIQRRASFITTSRRLICKWELNPQSFLWKRNVLTFWLLQIFAVSALWSRQQESNLQPTDYKSVALPIAPRRQKRVRWAVSISRILDGVTQPLLRSWSSECSIGEAGIVFTWLLMLVYELMDPVMVIETTSAVWKTAILAVELHRVI